MNYMVVEDGVRKQNAVTDRVLTVPNVITFVRLLMAPIALGLLLLLFCVPFWVFCAALALVLIVLGLWLL